MFFSNLHLNYWELLNQVHLVSIRSTLHNLIIGVIINEILETLTRSVIALCPSPTGERWKEPIGEFSHPKNYQQNKLLEFGECVKQCHYNIFLPTRQIFFFEYFWITSNVNLFYCFHLWLPQPAASLVRYTSLFSSFIFVLF